MNAMEVHRVERAIAAMLAELERRQGIDVESLSIEHTPYALGQVQRVRRRVRIGVREPKKLDWEK